MDFNITSVSDLFTSFTDWLAYSDSINPELFILGLGLIAADRLFAIETGSQTSNGDS